jgi:hypothetical protein
VLNLLEGVQTLNSSKSKQMLGINEATLINMHNLSILGLSQGGDVALTVLAISGEGSTIKNKLRAGSIWSGCFANRTDQALTYGPMTLTKDAFMSGDGSWTGSAIGSDNSINHNFVFAYPSDWIETLDVNQWTWQSETWHIDSVEQAARYKLDQMYSAITDNVANVENINYKLNSTKQKRIKVQHDQSIADLLPLMGGYSYHQFLTEKLNFHHSDRDFYSLPSWNKDIVTRINNTGGQANNYTYVGTNHSLRKSRHDWFSPPQTKDGLAKMVERDVKLFQTIFEATGDLN